MFKTLYSKLAAVLFLLFCILGAVHIFLTVFSTRSFQREINQKLNHDIAKHIAAEKLLLQNGRVDEDALHDIFHMLMVVNPSIEVYLLNPEGKILAFSAPPGIVKREYVSLAPVMKFLLSEYKYPILGDDPRGINRKKVFSATPVIVKDKLEGYLYIILGGEEYDSVTNMLRGSYILRLSLLLIGGSLIFTLLTGLLLFNQMTQRLRRLTRSMDNFRSHDFEVQPDSDINITDPPKDEIDRLSSGFKQMADRIHDQVTQLKESDKHRRELISNISHDLRTPMVSLQGYLETLLLKEGSLSTQEKRNYLTIAIKHCKRLEHLITELFELSKLDAPDMKLNLEPFSLSELVQDIAQKYQIQVEHRKINMVIRCKPNMPFIYADIGLIESVFENLIENAMRNMESGDDIMIELTPEDKNIQVDVSDTGKGIPREDLQRIFDRFYRGYNQQPGSSGLGLAITKRILELHGSDIQVQSTENTITTFTFNLPVYHNSNNKGSTPGN